MRAQLPDGLLVVGADGHAWRVFAPPPWRLDRWVWWWVALALAFVGRISIVVWFRARRGGRRRAAASVGTIEVSWYDAGIERRERVRVIEHRGLPT